MSTQEERRRYTRIDFANDAVLHQENNNFPIYLIDISLNGVLIEKPNNYALRTDQPTYIAITLTDEIIIEMKVRLIHESGAMLGFHCDSIDMMSMTHLRRLIELNIQEPNASDRVLEELISPVHSETNRRRETRYPHRAVCTLEIDENAYSAHMLNISEHGALVAVMQEHNAIAGDKIKLKVEMEDEEPISLIGLVAHVNLHYIGLRCDATLDADENRVLKIIAKK